MHLFSGVFAHANPLFSMSQEFSMAMMLKTLGVDVAILGYSETELNAA